MSTFTIALPMPTSAAPEINPAQIGSQPSTQISCAREPGSSFLRACHQKISAPIHIAKHDSGGSTTPSPTDTAEIGNRPLVLIRKTSNATAATAATIIERIAEGGRLLTPFAIRSATPFHWSAPGIAN